MAYVKLKIIDQTQDENPYKGQFDDIRAKINFL